MNESGINAAPSALAGAEPSEQARPRATPGRPSALRPSVDDPREQVERPNASRLRYQTAQRSRALKSAALSPRLGRRDEVAGSRLEPSPSTPRFPAWVEIAARARRGHPPNSSQSPQRRRRSRRAWERAPAGVSVPTRSHQGSTRRGSGWKARARARPTASPRDRAPRCRPRSRSHAAGRPGPSRSRRSPSSRRHQMASSGQFELIDRSPQTRSQPLEAERLGARAATSLQPTAAPMLW